jgi:hypothetical protein
MIRRGTVFRVGIESEENEQEQDRTAVAATQWPPSWRMVATRFDAHEGSRGHAAGSGIMDPSPHYRTHLRPLVSLGNA